MIRKQNARARACWKLMVTGSALLVVALSTPDVVYAQANAPANAQTPVPTSTSTPSAARTVMRAYGARSTPEITGPITLEESILIALHNHGDPGAAALQAAGARERIISARSTYYPQVSASANYDFSNRHTSTPQAASGGAVAAGNSATTRATTTNIAISQSIFDGGKTRQQIRQANAQSQSAVGGFGGTRNGLAFQVAQAFYEQLRQEKFVEQYQGQVRLAQEQVAQVQAQIEAGTAARVEIQTVQVTLSQARFNLVTAQNSLATARVDFRNVLGLGRGTPLQLQQSPGIANLAAPATGVGSTPVPPAMTTAADATLNLLNAAPPEVPALPPLEEFIAQAQQLRPDLVQARASVQQSEAAVALARIEQRPQVTANANYNLDPRTTDDRRFQLGIGLSIPIFNGDSKRAGVRAAQDELGASKINLEQTEKDVTADVETAYIDISGQVERIANARTLVEQAQTSLETATERYQLGLAIVLDVVNAQTQLFNAQTSATQAVYDYEIARANLDRAVGRFAWADPGQPAPPAAPAIIPVVLTRPDK